MKPVLAALLTATLLAACVPQSRTTVTPMQQSAAVAPAGANVLWARKDGRRMSTDPVLYEQGQQDRSRCEQEATVGGELQWARFARCMNAAGYNEMRQPG